MAWLQPPMNVDEQALVVFTRQFATIIHAGFPLVRCLDILSRQTESRVLQQSIFEVKRSVEGGAMLSSAFGRHPTVFSTLFVSMVKAGEVSGKLEEVLERLAGFLEMDVRLKKRLRAALTYPVVIFLMAIALLSFLVLYVSPALVSLLDGLNLTLPFSARILVTLTRTAQHPLELAPDLGLLAVAALWLRSYTRTASGKRHFNVLKSNLPLLGPLTKKVVIYRFCSTLGTLLSSGVPITQALDIAGKASGSDALALTAMHIRDSVREGKCVARSLGASGLFPPMVKQMVAIGVETGNLDNVLSKISDSYHIEIEYLLATLTSMLLPVMILGTGTLVGFFLVATFQPMYYTGGTMS